VGEEIAVLLGSVLGLVLWVFILRELIASGVRKGTRNALLDHAIFMEKFEAQQEDQGE
jgi:hypothetical protein